ncbi:MAG: hypothetical protein Q9227_006617 [Pyrenula ochraceoflavens]
MFREPEANNDAAAKVEASAATSRSPIRRRTIVIEDSRHTHDSRRRLHDQSQNRRSPNPENRYPERLVRDFDSRALNVGRYFQDAIGRARSNRESLRTVRRLDQARDSALRFELAPDGPVPPQSGHDYQRERSTTREFFMPSPPWSSSGNRSGFSPEQSRHSPSVTPDFAPANPHRNSYNNQTNRPGRNLDDVTLPGIHLALGDSYANSLPPLTRMSDRAPTPPPFTRTSPAPEMNGLGDRRRSVSLGLSDSSDGHDAWDTLLTTISPDENLPSVSSSFTSAEAAASAARSSSASGRSSQTTAPTHLGSFGERDNADFSTSGPQPCDLDSSDTDSMPDLISLDGSERQHSSAQPPFVRRTISPRRRLRWVSGRRPETSAALDHDTNSSSSDRGGSTRAAPRGSPQRRERMAHLPQRRQQDTLRRAGIPLYEPYSNSDRFSVRSTTVREPRYHAPRRGSPRASELEVLARELRRPSEENTHDLREVERRNAETQMDLASMQRLIERLARRDDIPNEWWAAAGLARTVRESQA